MNLCPKEQCEHYGNATKYPRKCYYEPQCWKGLLDEMISMIKYIRRGSGNSSNNNTSKE